MQPQTIPNYVGRYKSFVFKKVMCDNTVEWPILRIGIEH